MKYYLAVDIGASSGRHMLGYIDNGRLVTEEIYRFSNLPKEKLTEYGGSQKHLTWDTEHLYAEILNGLKRAGELGKIPATVGIDTWGVDYVLLGEDGESLGDVYCYRDQRTERAMEEVHKIIPQNELYGITGIQIASINTVYQLFCDRESGKLDKASSLLMLPDYFNFRLTGVKRQEYTNATTTGMVNALTHTWDENIISRLGYKKELFGELSAPGTAVGSFTDAVKEYVGYNATVLLPATHDTASAVLAAPLDSRTPYISSGTWSLLGVERTYAHTDAVSLEKNYSNEGSVNGDFRLQKNIMGLWMIQQVRHEANDAYSFAELAEMAKSSPVPYEIDVNDGRFLAPESMTEEICAAVGRKLNISEIAYVIYNNLAKSYAEAMDALEEITGEKYETLNIIGGGSKNGFLNELTAKYTRRKITAGPSECTAIGNILMQAVGSGDVASVSDGRKIIKQSFNDDITEWR